MFTRVELLIGSLELLFVIRNESSSLNESLWGKWSFCSSVDSADNYG